MHKKQTLALTGIGMLGAAVLLAGCGGSSLSTNNLGTRPSTLPYIYGLEPIAFYGAASAIGAQAAFEGSGFQDANSGQAYITGASGFSVVTNTDNATLPPVADPNGTGLLPFGFSTSGLYADSANQIGATAATVTSVPAGASVYFRAAIANGVSTNNTSPAITSATLTSTDASLTSVPGLTAGLPLTFPTSPAGGAFSNATYVTGTGGTATPFTIPASTTSGLHTVTCAVTDAAGRVTATTFSFPVLAATDAAVLARIVGTVPAGSPTTYAATVISGTATITNPIAGAVSQTTADADQNVFFFTSPGAQTITATATVVITNTATGATVSTLTQTGTLPVTTTAGGTISNAVVNVAGTTPAPTAAIRSHALRH